MRIEIEKLINNTYYLNRVRISTKIIRWKKYIKIVFIDEYPPKKLLNIFEINYTIKIIGRTNKRTKENPKSRQLFIVVRPKKI